MRPKSLASRRGRRFALLLAAALLSVTTASAPAAAQAWLAPEIAWGEHLDFAAGARFGISLDRLISADPSNSSLGGVEMVIAFEWFFDCSECNYFELTPGLRVPVELDEYWVPYIGSGLNIARLSVDTGFLGQSPIDSSDVNVGLALFGGLEFPMGSLTGFTELRITIGGASQTVLLFGLKLGG